MSALRIACLGIGNKDGHILSPVAADIPDVEIVCGDSIDLDSNIEHLGMFLKEVRDCRFMLIRVHGDVSYFRHFSELENVLEQSGCSAFLICTEPETTAAYRHLFRQGDGDYDILRRLEGIGGDDNHRALLLWALKTFSGADVEVPEPVMPPAQGMYVPGTGYVPLDEGAPSIGGKGRPVIAVLFHQKHFLVHNTAAVDELCRDISERGAEAVAVFMSSSEDTATGSIGIRAIVDRYLMRGGSSAVDCIVNTTGFSLTLLADPGNGTQTSRDNFFARLDVPVLQAITLYGSPEEWERNHAGLGPADIAMSVVNPEYDGQIDTVPVSGSVQTADGSYRSVPIADRCRMVADTAYRWASLRRKSNCERKVAVLVYMYPPRQDLAGGGYGLDTMQSVADLLRRMDGGGYSLDWVPRDGREMADRLLAGVTNDDNWRSERQIRDAAVDTVPPDLYRGWFSRIPESARSRMVEGWGDPPGDIHVIDGEQLLPGIMDGNVFIGFQPDRGKTTAEAYHDPWSAPPHQYLGFYRWLRDVWKADAVVHVGTHGTLEWLPGKGAGLSGECDPDIILGNIPNINPYIIDNPGEGMQAKRRSYAVITTHMIPAMTRSGGYAEIDELEDAVQAFLKAREYGQKDKLESITSAILALCAELNISEEAGIAGDCSAGDAAEKMDRLYDYILEIKDAMIKDGLHVLGEVPEDERMTETVYSLVRYANGPVPSLRESVARYRGWDLNVLLRDPSGISPGGMLNGEALDIVDGESFGLVRAMQDTGFEPSASLDVLGRSMPGHGGDLEEVVRFICLTLVPSIRRMGDELGSILHALEGGFVEPGPSGCPNRGRAQILPTGRNFYSIDPDGVPWHSSWEIGSAMADQVVERYLAEKGVYPREVGVVLWATDTMKTGGDDVSYILRLLGLRPVWTGYGGRVKAVEPVPLSELGRPRIDVTVRISGLFRDTFPNLVEMIDGGVQAIAALDEDDESNYLLANMRKDTAAAIASEVPEDEARRAASVRIFGDAPGQYGCGISDAIEKGDWKTVGDLGDVYVRHGCYAYGKGLYGRSSPDLFRRRLGSIDVTVKNHNSRAVDMLDMDDDLDALGGFNAAVEAVKGEKPVSFMGDSSDMQNLRLRTAGEEIRFIYRSKVDNPKWIDGLKRHGFSGAKELSKLFEFTLGWSGTSGIVDGWMFDDLAERFVLDDGVREWVKDENPYAMMEMLRRLDEAASRGMWDPSPEMLAELKDVYMEFEERIEEITDR